MHKLVVSRLRRLYVRAELEGLVRALVCVRQLRRGGHHRGAREEVYAVEGHAAGANEVGAGRAEELVHDRPQHGADAGTDDVVRGADDALARGLELCGRGLEAEVQLSAKHVPCMSWM